MILLWFWNWTNDAGGVVAAPGAEYIVIYRRRRRAA